jgi:hypothetical protein
MIGSITKKSLETAIEHVEQTMRSAAFLEAIGQRAVTAAEAELVLATIREKFPILRPRTIYTTKSELTYTLCQHGTRKGALSTDDLYDKVISYLESQGWRPPVFLVSCGDDRISGAEATKP